MSGDEHVFGLDEIREQNNNVPIWLALVWVFGLSWGAWYLVTYWNMPGDEDKKATIESSITYNITREEGYISSSKEPPKKEVKKEGGANEKLMAEGKTVYENNCAGCHGVEGNGNGPAAAALTPKPRNFIEAKYKYGGDDAGLTKTIENGVQGTAMPAWKDSLSGDQVKSVVAYIKAFKK